MIRVGVYLRISDDRDGTSTATARQREDCGRYAESCVWEVADVFEDVDLSAYKRNVRRPEFERMLAAVRDRHIDGVLAWKIDRLTRRQRDLVRLDEACEDAGGFIASVVEGIDTRQPTGRFVAELLVAQARMESENTSIRQRRKHEELKINGKPHTGGIRPFGYTADRSAVVPDEAALIRETVQRIYAGETLYGITWDWQRRGVTTPAGNPWNTVGLRRMLASAALSGQREHGGALYAGTWPAILTADDTRRLRAVLNVTGARPGPKAPRVNLLTGIARCGRCGHVLATHRDPRGNRQYVCTKRAHTENCGKLARLAVPVETFVREAVCIALDGVDLRAYVEQPSDHTGELVEAIRADEEALAELSRDYYAERRISRAEFFAAKETIDTRLERSRHALAKSNGHGLLASVIGAGDVVRDQWDTKGLDWRRAVVKELIDHVVIKPVGKGKTQRGFDPELVDIRWKF